MLLRTHWQSIAIDVLIRIRIRISIDQDISERYIPFIEMDEKVIILCMTKIMAKLLETSAFFEVDVSYKNVGYMFHILCE